MTNRTPSRSRIELRSDRGFTLVELMVTIGIIILAMGFLAPSIREAFMNRKLDSAGDLLYGKMAEARNNAVTSKRPWSVIFVQRGVYLYRHGREGEESGIEGGLERYEPDTGDGAEIVSYDLRFAGNDGLSYEDVPRSIALEEGEPLEESDEIYLKFMPDGTIDFNRNRDVSETLFQQGLDADIILKQAGRYDAQGLIDIRQTGRVAYRVAEIDEEE